MSPVLVRHHTIVKTITKLYFLYVIMQGGMDYVVDEPNTNVIIVYIQFSVR